MPFQAAERRLRVFDGQGYRPIFIKGMNMGVAIPGTQAGDLAPSRETYDRWLTMIGELGVNTIRLYTLHYPRFYEALLAYNQAHRDKPLYVFHGIWLDEENPSLDLFDMTSHYDDNILESTDCIHGNRVIEERRGRAHGRYTADISPWVIGWVIGREVFPDEVTTTNGKPGRPTSYTGKRVSLANGKAAELWWAERIDKLATYEAERYRSMRPISVSSWPTLDPLHHPTEGTGASEDVETIDLSKLDTTKFPPGYFATYHAYPYYPDFMNEDLDTVSTTDAVGPNSYLGYLRKLRAHYDPQPLIVAEVGVPSSWGNAHFSHSGMNHGGQDEVQQGNDDVRLLRNAHEADTGGAVLFAWIDEWWKRTWIVDELAMPRERYRLWHNVTSPEQNFGLLAFEPEVQPYKAQGGAGRITRVSTSADAEFHRVKIELASPLGATERLLVAYDTYADDRGETKLPDGTVTRQRSEFVLDLQGRAADLKVTAAYDQFGVWHDTQRGFLDPNRPYRSTATEGAPWNLVRWKNNGVHGSDDGRYQFPETVQDIGKLRVREASAPATSLDAVVVDGTTIDVRLPWTLLQVTDPTTLHVLDDNPSTRERETVVTPGFRLAIVLGASVVETDRVSWSGWEAAPAFRERKKASYDIFARGVQTVPNE